MAKQKHTSKTGNKNTQVKLVPPPEREKEAAADLKVLMLLKT